MLIRMLPDVRKVGFSPTQNLLGTNALAYFPKAIATKEKQFFNILQKIAQNLFYLEKLWLIMEWLIYALYLHEKKAKGNDSNSTYLGSLCITTIKETIQLYV